MAAMAADTSASAVPRRLAGPSLRRPETRRDFEIAIICALTLEADAVDALFDQHWDDDGLPYDKAHGDPNAYSFGAIGRHNVVLAYMPGMGKANAAAVAASCRVSFPNIKLAVVVGVCGVVPFISGDEILLGDVIISDGLVQYDLGRRPPERFVRKDMLLDSLGRPNSEIRALLAKLKGVRARRLLQAKIANYMDVLRSDPDLKVEYPGLSHDKLFEAAYRHIVDGVSCNECGCNGQLVSRSRLQQSVPQPTVHFGLIASGDTVMKSGEERDAIAQREKVVGFEMEGTGVWDSFPCVVIKGACDYADSHKTKVWQRYAAASAAACTKAFLDHWVPSAPPVDSRVSDDMPAQESSHEDQKVALLKRLWPSTSKYEEQKDRNPERVAGTCEWFIHHARFRNWQEKKGSALLWVSADPGCGKSVLVKYLVDEILPSTAMRTTCYFFFKDDFEDQKEIAGALCCILHQLFLQQPALLSEDILSQFEDGGEEIFTTFQDLWLILIEIISHENIGEVVCIFDALDECEEKGQSELTRALSKFYDTGSSMSSLKFIVTSRPYAKIQRQFQTLQDNHPTIRLSGENQTEVESISREIDVVVQARLDELSTMLSLSDDDKKIWRMELTRVKNRTYLWVYLVFDVIKEDTAIFSQGNLRDNIRNLPKTVEAAYDKILRKSPQIDRAKKLLRIVVAANRPLSLHEMAVALAITENHRSCSDLEAELLSPKVLRRTIREACGLFVTIVHSRIYLLHQTAREFLVQPLSSESVDSAESLAWHHSLCLMESNRVLSEICISYLLLADFAQPVINPDPDQSDGQYILLDYSAKNWAGHFRQAHAKTRKSTVSLASRLCDTNLQVCSAWFQRFWTSIGSEYPEGFSPLMLASYFGLRQVVDLLLKAKNSNITSRDATYGRSALSWASENGHATVVESLLHQVPKYKVVLRDWSSMLSTIINAKDILDRTPLLYASIHGHTSIVEMLIEKGANVNCEDGYGQTPLAWAVHNGNETTVELLLQRGAKHDSKAKRLESKDSKGRTALLRAAGHGHEAVATMLVERGADIEAKDKDGRTPLIHAVISGHAAVATMLVEQSADVESKDKNGQTPLIHSACFGHTAIASMLLERGADVEPKDKDGRTPLTHAARYGHEVMATMLLERGTDIEGKDNDGRTPLLHAARHGHRRVATMLIERGAEVETRDNDKRTPLLHAARYGHTVVATMLVERGADVEAEDRDGRTPLLHAARHGHTVVATMLVERGADVEATDKDGRTPLLRATSSGHTAVATMLVEKGADIEAKDNDGQTPLLHAISSGYTAVIMMLLTKGADIEAKDSS